MLTRALVPLLFLAMSKMAKSGGNPGESEMSFEEALKKLEAIVDSMESEELPLETLLARFEEGTKLAQRCQAKLAEAEVRIQELEKNLGGEVVLKALTEKEVAEEE